MAAPVPTAQTELQTPRDGSLAGSRKTGGAPGQDKELIHAEKNVSGAFRFLFFRFVRRLSHSSSGLVEGPVHLWGPGTRMSPWLPNETLRVATERDPTSRIGDKWKVSSRTRLGLGGR